MNILELCDRINLQPEIKSQVAEFSDSFDFGTTDLKYLTKVKLTRNLSSGFSTVKLLTTQPYPKKLRCKGM